MPKISQDNLAGHIMAALAPCRYEGLLSHRTIAEICNSEGGSLPADMTSLFGFECRLGQEEPVADFLVRTGAQPQEWLALGCHASGHDGEAWRRIKGLVDEHAKPDSPLCPILQNLWLEYDLISPMSTVSVPSIFFGTNRLTSNAETQWAVELAASLSGELLSAHSRSKVNELVAALPEAAKLFQVGIMCARPAAPLRVCVIGLEFEELPAFLTAANWPGEWSRIAEVLQHFIPVIDYLALDLDILADGQLAPKLGLELYQRPGTDLGLRLIEFVRRLSDSNLCLPQKATGLLAWGGITHERCYRDLWPATLIARRALRGGSESSTFCRWLHHTKIVLEPGISPTARAYLAVSHVFLADSVIREGLQQAARVNGNPPSQ